MGKLLYSNEMIFSNQELVNEKQITSKKNPLTIDKLNNCKVYVYMDLKDKFHTFM